uniref:Blue (Type1) copper domain-containing protein n=1 Tax=uncultured Chloroflexota bacterium TaxID=166587 RepID=H5SAL0_9CHLR|nr:blue (type1) copper domain-containing protein [uncultured Chloroflexota bacterium]
MKRFLFPFVLLVWALVLAGCAGKAMNQPVTSLSVELSDFKFTPDKYAIAAGQQIMLTLNNKGTVAHEFVIIKKGEQVTLPFDADDEDKVYWEHEVEPGNTETVTFTAPLEPGEYEVICGIPGHLEAGMKATLTVASP